MTVSDFHIKIVFKYVLYKDCMREYPGQHFFKKRKDMRNPALLDFKTHCKASVIKVV